MKAATELLLLALLITKLEGSGLEISNGRDGVAITDTVIDPLQSPLIEKTRTRQNPGRELLLTQKQIVAAHGRWTYCSQSFANSGTTCRSSTKFQPEGYFFEITRLVATQSQPCQELLDQDTMPVVECSLRRGKKLVVLNLGTGCTSAPGENFPCEDASQNPGAYGLEYELVSFLDGETFNLTYEWTTLTNPRTQAQKKKWQGCARKLPANSKTWLGYYAFIDTTGMEINSTHELTLLGSDKGEDCFAAVKHKFKIKA